MLSPRSILSKRQTRAYSVQIPVRASSATHLPLTPEGDQPDDKLSAAQAQPEQHHRQAEAKTRRRVSFDLNAIMHTAPPLALSDDEGDDDDEGRGQDETPPLRTSSLGAASLPLATRSSPDLFSSPRLAGAGADHNGGPDQAPPPRRSLDLAFLKSKARKKRSPSSTDRPLAIRPARPAKAKVARKHVVAQRHAAALELMLCGSLSVQGIPHQHAGPPSKLDQAQGDKANGHPHADEATAESKPKARRWSLLSRSAAPILDETAVKRNLENDTSAKQESETTSPVGKSTSDQPLTSSSDASKRLPLFRRASPFSLGLATSKDAQTGKEATRTAPPSASVELTPKQIRKLKAALLNMDLANGIIGELRARSLDPLTTLLGASQPASTAKASSDPLIESAAVPAQPRCILGPLLPPIQVASTAPASSSLGLSRRDLALTGIRDDSALPDPVVLADSDAINDAQEKLDNNDHPPCAPTSQAPHSAARRSLTHILDKVRARTSSLSTTASAKALQDEDDRVAATTTAPSAGALAATAAVGMAAVAAVALEPSPTTSRSTSATVATTSIPEEGDDDETNDEDSVGAVRLTAAIDTLARVQQAQQSIPKVFGMSPLSLALSPRTTIATQLASSAGAFDALADLSSVAVSPAGDATSTVGFPTDRLSFVLHWWGYEILLPPLAMSHLSTAQSISSAFLSFLQTMAISASMPELLPFLKYISMWVELEFRAIHEQDARGGGKGVVIAATWVMPMALVPRAWDYPTGTALPTTAAPSSTWGDVPTRNQSSRELRNRLDGPPVPAKDGNDKQAASQPLPAFPRFPSARPSFPSTPPSSTPPTPTLLPIPVRF